MNKHEGKSIHRLNSNPMEKAFHDAWLEENAPVTPGIPGGELLSWLLGDDNKKGEITERDALVAATVVQWLGSPVGQQFLEKVQERFVESAPQSVGKRLKPC